MNLKLNDKLLTALSGNKSESLKTHALYKVNNQRQLLILIRKKNHNPIPENEDPSDFAYYYNYKIWDNTWAEYKGYLLEMSEQNEAIIHEYDNENAIEQNAQILKSKILNFVSKNKNYETAITLVAMEQGGNIASECTQLLCKDNNFLENTKSHVASVILIAAPAFQNKYTIDERVFKAKGKVISYGNRNDLTQQFIAYFNTDNKIIASIDNFKNAPIAIDAKTIKMQYCKLLTELLLKTQSNTIFDSYAIEQHITTLNTELKKQIQAFGQTKIDTIQLKDILPLEALIHSLDAAHSNISVHVKSISLQLKKQNAISKNDNLIVLNVLEKIIDAFADFLHNTIEQKETILKFAVAISQRWNITHIETPSENNFSDLGIEPIIDVDKQKELIDKGELKEDFEFDMAGILAIKLKTMLSDISLNASEMVKWNEAEKTKFGEMLLVFLKQFYTHFTDDLNELIETFPYDLSSFTKCIINEEQTKRLFAFLSNSELHYPEKLQNALNKLQEKTTRLKSILTNNHYTFLNQDFRHYLFKSHNIVLEKCYGYLGQAITIHTGINSHMTGKGYKGISRPFSYDYESIGGSEIPNTIITQRINGQIM